MHSGFPTSLYLTTPFSFSTNNSSDTLEAMDEDSHSPTNENARELPPLFSFNAEIQTNPEKQTQLWQNFRQCIESLKKDDYAQLEHDIESYPDLRSSLDEGGHPLVYYYILINKKAINFEYLKKLQLNINIKDSLGFTPLQYAISLAATAKAGENIDRELVGGLIKLGAEVNVADSDGKTALHHAVEQGLPNVVGLLCENKAKVDSQDELGNRAFHYAISKKNVISGKSKDIIKTLHRYGADPNVQDQDGRTPLHLIILHFNALDMVTRGNKEFAFVTAIKALLNVGADKNIDDNLRRSVTTLDKNDLFKKVADLPEDHPVRSLDFKEDFIAEHSPSLKTAQPWENIPPFSIITGPNGSGKSHLLAYTRAFLKKFGRDKIHCIYKDAESLEKYTPVKNEFYHTSYSSSYYVSLSKKEESIIWQVMDILQDPSKTSSDAIVNLIARQIQPRITSPIDRDAIKDIVVKQYIISQVKELLNNPEGSPNKLAKFIAQQIQQDKKPLDITDEEILKYGSRAIKKNKEPLNSFHALSELACVFEEHVNKRKKIFKKYNGYSYFDTLFSAYCVYIKSQPNKEYYPEFIGFIKDPEKLQKLLNKIADDEVGAAPWNELNDLFRDNGLDLRLHYESISPNYSTRLFFTKKINDVVEIITIDQPDRLSAGERLILDILSWRYYIDKTGIVSKISMILLDEPDRHFDPEWSKIFMNCLTYLSEKHNIQVMMTTHRTDTLAYAPEGSIFTIRRDKITASTSIQHTNRLHALFTLTPNLRDLTNFHIKVCVEAFDDVMFYEKVYHQLLRISEAKRRAYTTRPNGLERKPHEILSRRFQLSFYSVALTKEGSKGGDAMVLRAVQGETLAVEHTPQVGIKALFDPSMRYPLGLIDADKHIANGTNPQGKITTDFDKIKDQIRFTKRYSLENYLYDPVILFSVLDERAINEFISEEQVELKTLAKACHSLITREVSSSQQNPFEAYFRYFIEELIKGDEKGEIHKDQYLEIYRYVNPDSTFREEVKKFNVIKQLQIDLSVSLGREIEEQEVIDELLKKDAKKISILSPHGVECYAILYPGLFIKARGHNLEEFFAGKTIYSKMLRNPKKRATAFKKDLINKMIVSPDIPLPADLVEVLFEINSKVRAQANSVIKPQKISQIC